MVAVAFVLALLVAALVVGNASWWCAYEDFRAFHLKQVRRILGQKRSEITIERGKRELAEAELAERNKDPACIPWASVEHGEAFIFLAALSVSESARERAEAELAAMREQEGERLQHVRQVAYLVDRALTAIDEAPWNGLKISGGTHVPDGLLRAADFVRGKAVLLEREGVSLDVSRALRKISTELNRKGANQLKRIGKEQGCGKAK